MAPRRFWPPLFSLPLPLILLRLSRAPTRTLARGTDLINPGCISCHASCEACARRVPGEPPAVCGPSDCTACSVGLRLEPMFNDGSGACVAESSRSISLDASRACKEDPSSCGSDSTDWWADDGKLRRAGPAYLAHCARAAENAEAFSRFKAEGAYRRILEHVPPALGQRYLDAVRRLDPSLLRADVVDRLRAADALGWGPERNGQAHFPGIGWASPTTMRYLHQVATLRAKVLPSVASTRRDPTTRVPAQRGLSLCEIGGGYGGFAHAALVALGDAVDRVEIFDRAGPAALANRFLAALGHGAARARARVLPARLPDLDGGAPPAADATRCDVVVSFFALTELDPAEQLRYADALVGSATQGALVVGLVNSLRIADAMARRGFRVDSALEDPQSGGNGGPTADAVPTAVWTFLR
jgi:hypothetical protein